MFLRALEEQLLLLKTRENERTSQVEDEDDRLEWDDSTEWDAQIYSSIGRALGAIIAREKEDFPVQRFTPFLVGLVRGGSGSKAFAGRLCYEIIAHMGSKAAGLVAPVLRGIGAMLTDQGTLVSLLLSSLTLCRHGHSDSGRLDHWHRCLHLARCIRARVSCISRAAVRHGRSDRDGGQPASSCARRCDWRECVLSLPLPSLIWPSCAHYHELRRPAEPRHAAAAVGGDASRPARWNRVRSVLHSSPRAALSVRLP